MSDARSESEPERGHLLDARTARMRLLLVSLIVTLQVISMIMMRQITPLYLESIDAGAGVIGVVVASFAFLPLLISMPSGVFMDRVGYRAVIFAGSASMVGASLLLALLPPVPLVILTQLVAGLANILVILATQAYVSNLGPPGMRTGNFALYSFSFGIAFLVGPPVAGIINDRWGYSAAFIAAAATALLVVLATRALAEIRPPMTDDPRSLKETISDETPEVIGMSGQLLRKPTVRVALGVSMCVLFVMTLRTSFYLVFLENIGFSSTDIGVLVAVQEGAALMLRPFLTSLVRRVGMVPLMVGSMAIGGLGVGVTPFLGAYVPLMAAAAVHGITPAFTQPLSMILMAGSAPEDKQGMAMGFRQTANQASLFVGPVVFGAVASWMTMTAVFLLAAAVLLGGAAVFALVYLWRGDGLVGEGGFSR